MLESRKSQMHFGLEDRIAIVTGAARGIGRATALLLAKMGAHVIASDLDEAALESVITEISDGKLGQGVPLPGDVTDPSFPNRLIQCAIDNGGLDIVVNNAGYTWDNVIQKTTDEQFLAMLEIHAVAPFRILRASADWFRTSSKSESLAGQARMRKVVNVSSLSGVDGNPGQCGYASGKAAVIGLTRTLAKEWGRYNVNVNAVAFGLMDTRLTKRMDDDSIKIGDRNLRVGMKDEVRQQMVSQIPLQRLGTPEEAAGAIAFLCSSLSDYITGELLTCSGGLHF
jgi:3-oxoacyl-[acyl-carrier protein] reductase